MTIHIHENVVGIVRDAKTRSPPPVEPAGRLRQSAGLQGSEMSIPDMIMKREIVAS